MTTIDPVYGPPTGMFFRTPQQKRKGTLWVLIACGAVLIGCVVVLTWGGKEEAIRRSQTDLAENIHAIEGDPVAAPGGTGSDPGAAPPAPLPPHVERVEYRSPNVKLPFVRRKKPPVQAGEDEGVEEIP